VTDISINDIRRFWDENPLFAGESNFEPGTKEFFEEHNNVMIGDCFAGEVDKRIFPKNKACKILDLGCGIGFWMEQFAIRGYESVTGVDISPVSIEIAKQRLDRLGKTAPFIEDNALSLSFQDDMFDHVNCQGVLHLVPEPDKGIDEIHRVLTDGGTAAISLFYDNILLRNLHLLSPVLKTLTRGSMTLKGRGRESLYDEISKQEMVRKFDGDDNPFGACFSNQEFERLLSEKFHIEEIYYHFFPKRAVFPMLPSVIHRILDRHLPFMIFANLLKK